MPGRKTSVYLTDELAERVRVSGVSIPELIRRGLGARAPDPVEVAVRAAVRAEIAEWWQSAGVALAGGSADRGGRRQRAESPKRSRRKPEPAVPVPPREADQVAVPVPAGRAATVGRLRGEIAEIEARPRGSAVFQAAGTVPSVTPVPDAPAPRRHAANCRCFVCKPPP